MNLLQRAWKTVSGDALRSWVVVLCALVVGAFALFSTLLLRGAATSLDLAADRMGADIIVVPEGTQTEMEGALLMGAPARFWMPEENVARLAAIPGVESVSPQVYLATLVGVSCCSVPEMFMIAYDPVTDFAVRPWLEKELPAGLGLGEVIGGEYISATEGEDGILVYGAQLKLRSNLEPTGTGLDQSLFFTLETAREIARISETRAEEPLTIPPNQVSAVLVRTTRGADTEQIAVEILRTVPGVYPIQSTHLFQSSRTQLQSMLTKVVIIIALLWTLAIALIGLLSLVIASQRRRELEVLRDSEEKLRTLFDILPIGVSILDEQRHVVQQNPALEQILQLSKAGLETGAFQARRYLRPDGTPMPRDEFPSARAARERSPARGQVGVVTEDGDVIWTDVSAQPVSLEDWRVVIATSDVTPLKRAEEALQRANLELEKRVEERTTSLREANRLLRQEVADREAAEAELRESEQQLEVRVAERTRELATLLEISNAVALSKELDPLLCQILDLLGEVVRFDGAMIYRLEQDELRALLHHGPVPEEEVSHLRMAVHQPSLAYDIFSKLAPISIPDIYADTPAARALREVAGERLHSIFRYVRSWLGIPLSIKGEVVGLLTLHRSEPSAFDERESRLAQAFAGQIAVGLENARLYAQAQDLAILEERQRLARELHDAVSQTLFSASLAAEVLPRIWDKDHEKGLECLDEVRGLTRGALAEMRTLLLELRPSSLVETEPAALLQQLAQAASSRAQIPVTVAATPHCALPAAVQVALYRIAQEALNNVVRHAGARQATINLRCLGAMPGTDTAGPATGVELSVADDGCGFDAPGTPQGRAGMGLSIMRERAKEVGAALVCTSAPGEGTRITFTWPAPAAG